MHTLKKFTENIGWLLIGTIISNIISLSVTIFLIRKLPVNDFGIYSLFFGSLSVFAMFSINGILISLTRFSPELIQKKYYSFHKSIIVKLFFISLFVTFIFVLLIFLYKETIGTILNIPNFSIYYSIFIINIFIYLEYTVSQNILIPLFEQKFLSIINVKYCNFYNSHIFFLKYSLIGLSEVTHFINDKINSVNRCRARFHCKPN